MNENRPSSFKFALTNGVLLGIALIAFALIMYLLEVGRQSPVQYLSFVIMIGLTFVFVKQWRDKHNEGFISFGGAYSHAFLTILIASVITSVYAFVFFSYIAPGEIAKILEEAEEGILKSQQNISDSDLDMAMSFTRMFTKPPIMAIFAFLGNILAGLLISFIPAVALKKERIDF